MVSTLARPKKADPEKYGQKKTRYSVMLTPEVSEKLDRVLEGTGVSRSEIIEIVLRSTSEENLIDIVVKALGRQSE